MATLKRSVACAAPLLCLLAVCSGADAELAGNSVPGLSGGVGNDLTLDYLYELETFESLPPGFTSFYFSGDESGVLPEGDDANPCTELLPCQSAERMEEILNQGSTIVYADGGFVSSAPGEEMEGFDGMVLTADACGEELCGYLLSYDPEQPPTFDCAEADEVTGSADRTFLRITGRIGVGNIRVHNCPNAPNGGSEFRRTFEVKNGGAKGVFIGTACIDAVAGHIHCFRTSAGGGVYLNIEARTRDVADFDEDCAGGTCAPVRCEDAGDPFDCCLADSAGAGDAGDSQCASRGDHPFEINNPTTLVTRRAIAVGSTQYASGNAGNIVSDCRIGPCHDVAIGPTLVPPALAGDGGPARRNWASSHLMPTDAGQDVTSYLVRARVLPSPVGLSDTGAAVRVADGTAATPNTVTVNLFQNTIIGAREGVRGEGNAAADTTAFVGKCNLFDELLQTSGDAYVVHGEGANAGTVIFDFDGSNAYDTDDGVSEGGSVDPDSFRFRDAEYDTASEIDLGDPDGAGGGWLVPQGFFGASAGGAEGALESGGEGTDGSYLSDEAMALSDDPALEDACPTTLSVPFSPFATIPSTATRAGVEITAIQVGTHVRSIGAGPLPEPSAGLGLVSGSLLLLLLRLARSRR